MAYQPQQQDKKKPGNLFLSCRPSKGVYAPEGVLKINGSQVPGFPLLTAMF